MEDRQLAQEFGPLKRIHLQLSELSKTQKKVASYILAHFDQAPFFTSAQLARACGVSESSVIRLATSLGYSGYSDFQRAMRDVLKSRLSLSRRLEMVTEGEGSNIAILHDVMQRSEKSISRALLSIDRDNFEAAVELLATSERVILFGARSSYALVYFLGLELRWIRNNVFVVNGENAELDVLTTLTERDTFLAISLPPYLRTTTRALELAHSKGTPTIAITDSQPSPLMPHATYPLLVNSEIFSYSDNIVPIASTITALLNAVGVRNHPRSNELLAEHEKTWEFFDMYLP